MSAFLAEVANIFHFSYLLFVFCRQTTNETTGLMSLYEWVSFADSIYCVYALLSFICCAEPPPEGDAMTNKWFYV